MHDFTCRELEVRIGEMENLVAEHPRDWKNNLLFHGIEMQPKETFYSLALIVSKIIRFEFNRKLITIEFKQNSFILFHKYEGFHETRKHWIKESIVEILNKSSFKRGGQTKITMTHFKSLSDQ